MTTGSQRGAVCVGVILFLAAGVSAAQSWRGRADIEVRVSSRKGGNLSGARVELKYRDGRSDQGPPAVATDGRGRAIVLGLAAGVWQVEVKHPDFMSFVAVVRLDAKEKPQITASFLEASSGSSAPIQVKLLKAKGGPASPPLWAAEAATQPPPTEPSPAPRVEPEPVPAEPRLPETASAMPSPVPFPEPERSVPTATQPEPTPEPAAPTPEPREPAPAPAPVEVEREVMPEPEMPEPEVPAPVEESPEPEPMPEMPAAEPEAPEPEPMPEVAVAEPEVPELEPAPQMTAAKPQTPAPIPAVPDPVVEETPQAPPAPEPAMEQPAADPPPVATVSPEPMPEPMPEPVPEVVPEPEAELPTPEASSDPAPSPAEVEPAPAAAPTPAAAPASAPELEWRSYRQRNCAKCRPGQWAVTVAADLRSAGQCSEDSAAAATAAAQASAESAQIVGQLPAAGDAGCRVLGIVLAKGSRFVGFEYEHESTSGRERCLPDQACTGGDATFIGSPSVTNGAAATVVHALASGNDGTALMTIFFRAPSDRWTPEP